MTLDQREKLARILRVLASRETVTPGDVVVETGLPRYEVLAAFHFLEALGVVRLVYQKGSYKIYMGTRFVNIVLEALQAEEPLEYIAERLAAEKSIGVPVSTAAPEAAETA